MTGIIQNQYGKSKRGNNNPSLNKNHNFIVNKSG